eukprot:gene1730-33140_t
MNLEARFKGHTASILCCIVAPGENPTHLASGGEDGLRDFSLDLGLSEQHPPLVPTLGDGLRSFSFGLGLSEQHTLLTPIPMIIYDLILMPSLPLCHLLKDGLHIFSLDLGLSEH